MGYGVSCIGIAITRSQVGYRLQKRDFLALQNQGVRTMDKERAFEVVRKYITHLKRSKFSVQKAYLD